MNDGNKSPIIIYISGIKVLIYEKERQLTFLMGINIGFTISALCQIVDILPLKEACLRVIDGN